MRATVTLTTLALLAAFAAAGPALAQECPPPSTADVLFETMTTVADLEVPNETALLTELSGAMVNLATDDTDAALAALASFVGKVEAQSGKKIPVEAAEMLLLLASEVVEALTPPPTCSCTAVAEFAALLADPSQVTSCQFGFFGSSQSVELSTLDFNAAVYGAPDAGDCRVDWVPRQDIADPEEFAVCWQMMFDVAAAAGVPCWEF